MNKYSILAKGFLCGGSLQVQSTSFLSPHRDYDLKPLQKWMNPNEPRKIGISISCCYVCLEREARSVVRWFGGSDNRSLKVGEYYSPLSTVYKQAKQIKTEIKLGFMAFHVKSKRFQLTIIHQIKQIVSIRQSLGSGECRLWSVECRVLGDRECGVWGVDCTVQLLLRSTKPIYCLSVSLSLSINRQNRPSPIN